MESMTHRERMLAAMRGESTDRIPWAPRMDLWAIAQRARGTLPARFDGNTAQIADALDVACHAVRADYTQPRPPADLALRGIGLDNHPDYPFRVQVRDLPVRFEHAEGRYETVIETTAGPVVSRIAMTARMAADGISIPFVEKYPITSAADLDAVGEVFEHLEVVPAPAAYAAFHDRVGERGVAVANGHLVATPMHLMLHDLAAMEDFYVLYAEQRQALETLAARMTPFFEAMLDATLESEAEVLLWGANYDQDTTWPPFFESQIKPWLQRVSRRVHAAGRLLLTHTDGENRGLMPLYPGCGFDVGESVCPAPMTSCTLAEIRAGMGSAVWGGVPCVVLLDDVMDESAFERYMDDLFADLGSAAGLILGVSDNVPPDVNMGRLEKVRQWIDAFGPVDA